jgi:competence ComEA-like helix-hairpin-helix protein
MPSFSQLKLSADSRPLVDRALARASSDADKARIQDALVKAAGVDGNKVLSAKEVQAVVDAFETAAPGNAALSAAQLGLGLDKANAALGSMATLGNVDGITNDFTLEGASVETKLIAQLNDTIARAGSRPCDVNMLIFEFQSDAIEKAISDAAKTHPNVTFRIIADSTQATGSGGNALPVLLAARLPNVQVKFKKDFPYTWNPQLGRPDFNHGATQGLNHHKGFVSTIDGKPDTLVTGSFNWSNTADTKNYEDLTTFRDQDSSSRRALGQFAEEFTGYWNNPDAALSPNAFQNFKGTKWNELLKAHGKPETAKTDRPDDSYPLYAPKADTTSVDLNGYRASDEARLATLLGSKTLAKKVLTERKNFGRFADAADLKERVPETAGLSAEKLQALTFGSGKVSINTATAEELDKAGLTAKQAKAVVAWREKNGDFDDVGQLRGLGIPQTTLQKVADVLTAIDVEAFFSSRAFGAPQAGTGYGPSGGRTAVVAGADGVVSAQAASVTAGATDLFNRAKSGESISVAMYGMSPSAPEFVSLAAAAKRGAKVRVVLNDDGTQNAVAALKALAAQGLSVEVRIQSAKTMHEKFGVVGDDVFFGSANFSESSTTKHSENRVTVKNDAEVAGEFTGRFENLWAKSKVG